MYDRNLKCGLGLDSLCGNVVQLLRASIVPVLVMAVTAGMSACGKARETSPAQSTPAPSTQPAPATSPSPAVRQIQSTDMGSNKESGKSDQVVGVNPTGAVTEVKVVTNGTTTIVKANSSPAPQGTITASNAAQGNLLNGILAGAGSNLLTQTLLKDNPKLATALTSCLFTLGLGLMDSNSILASIQKVTGTTVISNGTTQNTQITALTGCLTNLVK